MRARSALLKAPNVGLRLLAGPYRKPKLVHKLPLCRAGHDVGFIPHHINTRARTMRNTVIGPK